MKIVTKKTIKKECWNLDYELIKWLNEHLKVFYDDANGIIDLEFHVFYINEKRYTQKQAIERLIQITDKIIENDYWISLDLMNLVSEMYDILKEIHYSLWW